MIGLKKLRQERKLSQTELAKILGTTTTSISYYENGEREMSYKTLFRLANYFEVSIDELLGYKKDINEDFLQPCQKEIYDRILQYDIHMCDRLIGYMDFLEKEQRIFEQRNKLLDYELFINDKKKEAIG